MIEVPPARIPEEPGAVIPHAGTCEGASSNRRLYLDRYRMKTSQLTLLTLIVALGFSMSVTSRSEEEPLDQTENIQARIAESEFIVDICVYEMEWIPATPDFPKAKCVQRAVVTGVHKGVIPIGTKLEFYNTIEDPPKLFKTRFRTVVEGELLTFFFSRDEGTLKDGKYTLDAPGNFSFGRGEGDFARAFQKELKTNLDLKPKSELAVPPDGP